MTSILDQSSVSLSIEMLGHNQARGIDELWAGISDIKERRKLQNRLNRRAYSKFRDCSTEFEGGITNRWQESANPT